MVFILPTCVMCFPCLRIVRGELSVQCFSSILPSTAQEEIFGELHWCSGLLWIAGPWSVFHNGTWTVAAWYIAPRGESALCTNLSVPGRVGRQKDTLRPLRLWPPIIFRIYLMVWPFFFFFHKGNVLSDHTQAAAVSQMFLLWFTWGNVLLVKYFLLGLVLQSFCMLLSKHNVSWSVIAYFILIVHWYIHQLQLLL